MKQMASKRVTLKTLTVRLDSDEYQRLTRLAKRHRPPLSLQYVLRFAVQLLLERSKDPRFAQQMRDPTATEE
jgi:hypothetical protein